MDIDRNVSVVYVTVMCTLGPTLRRGVSLRSFPCLVVAVVLVLGTSRASLAGDASNDAMLRLLRVLRDRGSISAQEYDDIRLLAEAPAPAAIGPAPAQDLTARLAEQDKAIAEVKAATAGTPAPVVSRALAGKWYERISLRGYTQFRREEVTSSQGAVLEVPADRSVNPNESYGIRRGRLVFSGDVAEHLSVYAQTDFNGNIGTGDFALQMRDLYGDVWLDKDKAFRVRLGQSKVPFGWVNLQSSQNRAPLERPDALNSAVEGERDLGAAVMWASPTARQRFRDLTALGLKGSGDYGVAAVGRLLGAGPQPPRPERRSPRRGAGVLSVQDRRRAVLRARRPGVSRPLRVDYPGAHRRRRDLHAGAAVGRRSRPAGRVHRHRLSAAGGARGGMELRRGSRAVRRPALDRIHVHSTAATCS